MKKEYHKPKLIYEDFSLAGSNIAACQVDPISNRLYECTVNPIPGYDDGFNYLFDTQYGRCTMQPPAGQWCPYDVSGEAFALFSS